MKPIRFLVFTILSVFLMTACNNDDDSHPGDAPVAVRFDAGHIATTRITAGGDQWTANDLVGIFMIAKDAANIAGNIKENADNVKYRAQIGNNAASGFIPVNSIETIYYPQNGDKVDFIAYYPHQTPLPSSYTYPIAVSDQSNPAAIDVLYSNNAKAKDKNSGTVDLHFNHALSKLSFTLTSGVGSPNLAGAKVEISGVASTATMELKDGTVTATNSAQTLTANTAADGLTSSAIVIPQSAAFVAEKLVVTVPNTGTFEWEFKEGSNDIAQWEAGKNHQYNITVNRTGITVTPGDIADWTGTATSPTEGGAGVWKVGDYYPDPNVIYSSPGVVQSGTAAIGIVFWIDPSDSRHGKVVSLDEAGSILKWANYNSSVGATDMTNGRVNMQAINNKNNWGEYPAFNWVHNTKNGGVADYSASATGVWYLPARDELEHLCCVYNDQPLETWENLNSFPSWGTNNNVANAAFNAKLTAAGGTILNNYYWSSSEDGIGVYVINFDNGRLVGNMMELSNSSRCVRYF